MGSSVIGHGIADYLVVVFFVFYAIYAGLTKTHRVLYILPAAVSFFFFIEVGPRFTPDTLVPTFYLLTVIIRFGWDYFKVPTNSTYNWLLLLFFTIVYSFFIGSYSILYFDDLVSSPHLSTRLYIQLIGYINSIFIYIIVRRECYYLKGVDGLLKSFIWTTIILCIYGFYQYIANKFGLPFRGIVYSEAGVGLANVKTGEDTFFRVNSFANEPKRLSYFIGIGIIILLKYKNYFYEKFGRLGTFSVIIGHIVILWWTYSTSIYFSIAIFILSIGIYGILFDFNKRLLNTLVIIAILGTGAYFFQQKELDALYNVRVEEQLENDEVRAEVKGLEYVKSHFGLFVLGIGPGMYNFALAAEFPNEAGLTNYGKKLIPFNAAFVAYLFDFGIVGSFILLIPLLRLIFISNYAKNQISLLLFFVYCVCFTLDPTPTLFIMLGAFEAEQLLTT